MESRMLDFPEPFSPVIALNSRSKPPKRSPLLRWALDEQRRGTLDDGPLGVGLEAVDGDALDVHLRLGPPASAAGFTIQSLLPSLQILTNHWLGRNEVRIQVGIGLSKLLPKKLVCKSGKFV